MREEKAEQPKRSASGCRHNRLPFALCKEFGIDVQEGWTPRDAWDALKDKGAMQGSVSDAHKQYFSDLKNSKKSALAGLKIELEYAQMKQKEFGNVKNGGTRETRKKFQEWNDHARELQAQIMKLEQDVKRIYDDSDGVYDAVPF